MKLLHRLRRQQLAREAESVTKTTLPLPSEHQIMEQELLGMQSLQACSVARSIYTCTDVWSRRESKLAVQYQTKEPAFDDQPGPL